MNHGPKLAVDIDGLNNAPRESVANGTFGLIDRLQGYGEPIRVLAAACLFLLVCRNYGLKPQDMLEKANNLMSDTVDRSYLPQFRAAADYLRRFKGKQGA